MMSVTSAARRLLRTLSLSQPTAMTDLQRDGRGGPAVAGTDSSSTGSCFELELWPSQSAANSRRLSFHCSSSISISPAADRRDNYLRDGQYHSEFGGETSEPRNIASLCIDTPSSYESHIQLLPRPDSSDSISSSASSASCASDNNNEGAPNRRSASTTGVPPIVAWSTPRTRSNATRTAAKKKERGDEADELFWRGYWD
ncbi:hypothetical protein F4680DRAFT_226552 [Xylaria scruposa]|nr:hypothetical protein F4680DRAFT_226552 [Xylaria scruposa]